MGHTSHTNSHSVPRVSPSYLLNVLFTQLFSLHKETLSGLFNVFIAITLAAPELQHFITFNSLTHNFIWPFFRSCSHWVIMEVWCQGLGRNLLSSIVCSGGCGGFGGVGGGCEPLTTYGSGLLWMFSSGWSGERLVCHGLHVLFINGCLLYF